MNEAIAQALVKAAKRYIGVEYQFGAKDDHVGDMPKALDCSGLVHRVFHDVQAAPDLPQGSKNQACSKLMKSVDVATALKTPGALLFCTDNGALSGINHVGISAGDGTAIEANGYFNKVIQRVPKKGYWDKAMLVKGVHW